MGAPLNRDQIIALVIQLEGGLVDNPADPGGRTNMGITQRYLDNARTHDATLPATVDALTVAQVTQLYQTDQWATVDGDNLPAAIATLAFDGAVNEGPGTAVMLLQQALGILADGKMGSGTRGAVNGANWAKLAAEYAARRAVHYATIGAGKSVFELGWMRRLITVYTAAVK